MSKYPAIRVSQEQVSAAAAAIKLARTSYLPRADFLAQANRASPQQRFRHVPAQRHFADFGPVLGTNLAKQRVGHGGGCDGCLGSLLISGSGRRTSRSPSPRVTGRERSQCHKAAGCRRRRRCLPYDSCRATDGHGAKAGVERATSPEPDRGNPGEKRAKAWRRGVSDEGGARGSRNAINPG